MSPERKKEDKKDDYLMVNIKEITDKVNERLLKVEVIKLLGKVLDIDLKPVFDIVTITILKIIQEIGEEHHNKS